MIYNKYSVSVVAAGLLSLNGPIGTMGFGFGTPVLSGKSRTSSTTLSMNSALIVQNKGGGHGELGYQLAKKLQSDYNDVITSITILQITLPCTWRAPYSRNHA